MSRCRSSAWGPGLDQLFPGEMRWELAAQDLAPAQLAKLPDRLGVGDLDAVHGQADLDRLGADRPAVKEAARQAPQKFRPHARLLEQPAARSGVPGLPP